MEQAQGRESWGWSKLLPLNLCQTGCRCDNKGGSNMYPNWSSPSPSGCLRQLLVQEQFSSFSGPYLYRQDYVNQGISQARLAYVKTAPKVGKWHNIMGHWRGALNHSASEFDRASHPRAQDETHETLPEWRMRLGHFVLGLG